MTAHQSNTLRFRDSLSKRLRDVLDARLDFFQLTMDRDSGALRTDLHRCDDHEIAEAIGQLHDPKQLPMTVSLGLRQVHLFDTKLDGRGRWLVAVTVPGPDSELVPALIGAHIDAIYQERLARSERSQTVNFLEQITQDFEELTWHRSSGQLLHAIKDRTSIRVISEQLLDSLLAVMSVECIAYIEAPRHATPNLDAVGDCPVLLVGQASCPPNVIRSFIQDNLGTLQVQPVVANFDCATTPTHAYPGIRNCIACTIIHDHRLMGWLVACNKIRSPFNAQDPASPWEIDESGTLSTFGAGLLQNCASMLAAYGSSLEHIAAQEASLTGIIHCIVNALEAKDKYTCGHSGRVALYATVIAEQLGLDSTRCREIHMTGLLHDVGKIGVPDAILGKPARLTDEEFEIVKQHPQIGYDILRHIDDFSYVLPGVLHHHEAFDGSGYPHRLAGAAIPMDGRILAVADAYDAMTSDRPYRTGMPHAKAEAILREERGKMWDPQVVDAFLACWESGKLSPHAPPSPSTPDLPLTDTIPISPWRLELSAVSASL